MSSGGAKESSVQAEAPAPVKVACENGVMLGKTADGVVSFKGIPYDVLKAAAVEVAVVRVVPTKFEMYDTDFVKQGFDVRQIVVCDR